MMHFPMMMKIILIFKGAEVMTMNELGFFVFMDENEREPDYPRFDDSDVAHCTRKRKNPYEDPYADRWEEDDECGFYDNPEYDYV